MQFIFYLQERYNFDCFLEELEYSLSEVVSQVLSTFLVCVLECLTWVVFFAYMFFFLCIKRHIYTRLVERNVSPSHAELLVFLMSAALCEVQSTLLASLERNYQCFLTSFGTGYIAPLLMAVSDSYLTGLQYHI